MPPSNTVGTASTGSVPDRVAITGATGYIGGLVARRFAAAGWDVIALGRSSTPPVDVPVTDTRAFVLGREVAPEILRGSRVLVHCAYDFSVTEPADIERVNVIGTERLLKAAGAGVERIVFISSMSAYEGTEQLYGRAKLSCEAAVARCGGVSVRLGLVYGSKAGGMAGALARLVKLPVVPLVGARSYQFTVHAADVADGLFAVSTAQPPVKGTLGLAHPEKVPFRALLTGLADPAGRRPRFVSVPWQPVYSVMRAAERAHLRLPLRSDSLLGLVRPAPTVPRTEEWRRLGVVVRPFQP